MIMLKDYAPTLGRRFTRRTGKEGPSWSPRDKMTPGCLKFRSSFGKIEWKKSPNGCFSPAVDICKEAAASTLLEASVTVVVMRCGGGDMTEPFRLWTT